MKKYVSVALSISSFVLLCQFSQQPSVRGREKPAVNIEATIIDRNGEKYDVEHLTIKGRFHRIPMYKKPPSPKMTPSHTFEIDLEEEREIVVPYEGDKPRTYKFGNREFIEIDVVSKDSQQTKNSYIIEKAAHIESDIMAESGPKRNYTTFNTIDKIIVKGPKPDTKKPQPIE